MSRAPRSVREITTNTTFDSVLAAKAHYELSSSVMNRALSKGLPVSWGRHRGLMFVYTDAVSDVVAQPTLPGVPSSKAEARAAGATEYFSGKPCHKGHIAMRRITGHCKECAKDTRRKAVVHLTAYQSEYRKSDAYKAWYANYYARNRDKFVARVRSYRARKAALATLKPKA